MQNTAFSERKKQRKGFTHSSPHKGMYKYNIGHKNIWGMNMWLSSPCLGGAVIGGGGIGTLKQIVPREKKFAL